MREPTTLKAGVTLPPGFVTEAVSVLESWSKELSHTHRHIARIFSNLILKKCGHTL